MSDDLIENVPDPVTEPANDLGGRLDELTDRVETLAARLDLVEGHSHDAPPPEPPDDRTPVKPPWTHRHAIPHRGSN